jgi:hypothetical protein
MAKVVALRLVNPPENAGPVLQDVPALLRSIADQLEAGDYGLKEAKEEFGESHVCRGALVLRISGQTPHTFGLGNTDSTQAFMDLHAGAQEIMNMLHPMEGSNAG